MGKTAELLDWTAYQLRRCPYPLTVGLERFPTPGGANHAVLLRYQSDKGASGPDLVSWFNAYNGRSSVDAGIKQAKSVFQVQHLMSCKAVGRRIPVALTLFATNFVPGASAWLAERIVAPAPVRVKMPRQVQRLVWNLANSPGTVERPGEQLLVRWGRPTGWLAWPSVDAGVRLCNWHYRCARRRHPGRRSTASWSC